MEYGQRNSEEFPQTAMKKRTAVCSWQLFRRFSVIMIYAEKLSLSILTYEGHQYSKRWIPKTHGFYNVICTRFELNINIVQVPDLWSLHAHVSFRLYTQHERYRHFKSNGDDLKTKKETWHRQYNSTLCNSLDLVKRCRSWLDIIPRRLILRVSQISSIGLCLWILTANSRAAPK